MQPIATAAVQQFLESMKNQDLYIHLEMTMGAYASHNDSSKPSGATFIRNAIVRYSHGTITGVGPYRVGLKMEHGWIYSEGLTHWEETGQDRLIMAGHDSNGKLVVALQLSRNPF